MADFIIDITNRVFAVLFLPFQHMRPDYALVIITVASGIAMFYLYVWTSDQAGLKKIQDKVKAHIFEIQLYKTDLIIMLRSLYRVFARNMTYLRLLILPAALLVFIVVVIVVQCYPRFQYRPVRPGESVLFKASVKNWDEKPPGLIRLEVPDGLSVETAPLVVPSLREVNWRLKAARPGEYPVVVKAGGERQVKKLMVGDGLVGVSPLKASLTFTNYVENPLEPPLAGSSIFKAIEVKYPVRRMGSSVLLGMNWIVYYFVVSFVVALVVKFVTRSH